jgi:hypothetical protein
VLRALQRLLLVPAMVIEEIAQKGTSDEVLRSVQETGFLDTVPDVPIPPQVLAWRLGAGEAAVLALALRH